LATRWLVTDGQEVARALRAAYWAMHRRTNAILAGHGVTADQFVLISRLAEEDGITQKELARRASSDPNTIGPMLLLLEKAGFVARRAHASDGRALCVLLTAEGRRRFRAMMEDTERCRRQMVAAVRYGSARGLWKNLKEIAQVLESPA
jgi:DNA-binding MarR family transcriptional regulator